MKSPGCLVTILILALLAAWYEEDRFHHPPPGITAPDEPRQDNVAAGGTNQWPVGDSASAHALATYRIHARVLGACHYSLDDGAKIAPVDLALGWGKMSDWSVYSRLGITQRGRYYLYFWGPGGPPIAADDIITHSANNHVIPADAAVAKILRGIRTNDLIWMEGDLVEVNGRNGFTWRSSLTRQDTGGGACELVRATRLVVEPSDRYWDF